MVFDCKISISVPLPESELFGKGCLWPWLDLVWCRPGNV